MEEHRRLGANTDLDVSYQYLTFFMEDSERLKQIKDVSYSFNCGGIRILTGMHCCICVSPYIVLCVHTCVCACVCTYYVFTTRCTHTHTHTHMHTIHRWYKLPCIPQLVLSLFLAVPPSHSTTPLPRQWCALCAQFKVMYMCARHTRYITHPFYSHFLRIMVAVRC